MARAASGEEEDCRSCRSWSTSVEWEEGSGGVDEGLLSRVIRADGVRWGDVIQGRRRPASQPRQLNGGEGEMVGRDRGSFVDGES